MYTYLKALHIIFVVTWFSGMFYMPRLFIYNTEAEGKPEAVKNALHEQFNIMMRRLWFGITTPSAVLTLILGLTVLFQGGWQHVLLKPEGRWLLVKIAFVVALYVYHYTLQVILRQQLKGIFIYTSFQLRLWNEVATMFLISIVMLATVKQSLSFVWGLLGLVLLIIALVSAIKIYKLIRNTRNEN